MNMVILMGEIASKIEYKFIYKGRKNAKAKFTLKLANNNIINIVAYNKLADELYQRAKLEETITVTGRINTNMQVEIEEFYIEPTNKL